MLQALGSLYSGLLGLQHITTIWLQCFAAYLMNLTYSLGLHGKYYCRGELAGEGGRESMCLSMW